jgi:UDP-N-acetyl-D-mannosaminuronic acid dehydrogenase
VDPWFLVETAPELTPLIYHARQVNDEQPHFVLRKVKQALGSLAGKKIAALGLAFKPDVDDLRESPAREVIHLLQKEGAQVKAWEPFKPDAHILGINITANLDAAIEDSDAILLLVKHTEFERIDPVEVLSKSAARIVIDCVNGWDSDQWENAGFAVYRLGVSHY